jgi:hypothetical protein
MTRLTAGFFVAAICNGNYFNTLAYTVFFILLRVNEP